MPNLFEFQPVFMTIWFIFFFGILFFILYRVFMQLRRSAENSNKPIEKVYATLVGKTAQEHYHHNTASYTERYLTFETPSGERIVLEVNGEEYALFIEGDHGLLTHQGYTFIDFEREMNN